MPPPKKVKDPRNFFQLEESYNQPMFVSILPTSAPKEVLSAPEYGDVVRVITEPVAYEKFLELVSQHQSAMAAMVLGDFFHWTLPRTWSIAVTVTDSKDMILYPLIVS